MKHVKEATKTAFEWANAAENALQSNPRDKNIDELAGWFFSPSKFGDVASISPGYPLFQTKRRLTDSNLPGNLVNLSLMRREVPQGTKSHIKQDPVSTLDSWQCKKPNHN